MKWRDFLKAGSAGLTSALLVGGGFLSWKSRAYATNVALTYYITHGSITQPDGVSAYFRGYSSSSNSLQVPGNSFVVQQGDTVTVTIHNKLGTTHSFKIDGIVDSGPIAGGSSTTVQFQPSTAGSYLFYDGHNEPYGRLVGLHGAMAVMPLGLDNQVYAGSPTFVQQKFWVFNQIDPVWHSNIRNRTTPSTPFTPRYFTINGLSARPPGAPGHGDPAIDAMHDHETAVHGHVGDRTLLRMLNAGLATHAVHTHGNHMEWLTSNGQIRPVVWLKDTVPLDGNKGVADVIFPFEAPPDAWPPASTGIYAMHLHDEMTQTAGGGLYMFGALTDICFE